MNKKYSVILGGNVENYFTQLYLHPLLLVVCAIVIRLVSNFYNLEMLDALLLFIVCWGLLGSQFTKIKPFYCLASGAEGVEGIKVTVGYRTKKLSGILKDVCQVSESLKFNVQTKKGVDEIAIPSNLLGIEINAALIETLKNTQETSLETLKENLSAAGISAQVKVIDDMHYNLHAGTKPNYIPTRLILTLLSLLISVAIIYEAFV